MEAFKNLYNKKSLTQMALEIKKVYPEFEEKTFVKKAMKNFNKLEMKDRVVQVSSQLELFLPGPYKNNIKILKKTLKTKDGNLEGFILWPYSYYAETKGIDDFSSSMSFLSEITKCFTAEWGVRPFLEHFPDKVYEFFHQRVNNKNEHIRRWISEGTRPNLPWGMKISHIEDNFSENLKLLDKLKDDSSEYVRKSVANHMNDISWYDSNLVIKTIKRWRKIKTKEMDQLIARALRSLLKQGNVEALALLGYNAKSPSKITQLKLSRKRIKEGDSFNLSFDFINQSAKETSFMIDYIIGYPKANGNLSFKTFKLKNVKLQPKALLQIGKKISFRKVTTRTHYKGLHKLQIQVNGKIKAESEFKLI